MRCIVFATGGTGGHIFPALAVAEEVRHRYPEAELLFFGGRYGPEGCLAQEAGMEFYALPARGVLGRGLRSATSLVWLSRSLMTCWWLFHKRRPDAVLGLGGYAGFAPVLAAAWSRIPCAVHEQNSIPGVTNRVLAKRVDRVLVSFPDESRFFPPEKTVFTGNPVRREIVALRATQKTRLPRDTEHRVLILGGSQGAQGINAAVIRSLPSFARSQMQLWHQTGTHEYEEVHAAYVQAGLENKATVEAFISDMAAAYDWADLVVCRAGATTIAELTAVGKPAVLIPFPHATHNHQQRNAASLEAAGAALVLRQQYLQEVNLARAVEDLVALPGKLKEMGKAARRIGRPEAAAHVVDQLETLATRRSTKDPEPRGFHS